MRTIYLQPGDRFSFLCGRRAMHSLAIVLRRHEAVILHCRSTGERVRVVCGRGMVRSTTTVYVRNNTRVTVRCR